MESSRLKNIVILILALLNLCLLGLLTMRKAVEYSSRDEAKAQLVALFAAEGVRLEEDAIPDATPPSRLTLSRSDEEDRKLAAFLLGRDLSRSDGGGGIRVYRSTGGEGYAVLRSSGSFDVVNPGADQEAEDLCRAFCRAFQYEELSFSLEGGTGTAAAVQYHDGAPVVNCTVTFTIENGVLRAVSGIHLPEEAAADTGTDHPLSALTSLALFLNTVKAGAVVTEVTDIYLCYELQSTSTAPMVLAPAWCVATDTANYYVNCFTGAVSQG